jgi:sulfur carrier protein
MIQVLVNGEMKQFQHPLTVQEMLETLSLPSMVGLAVAVNEEVLSKAQWKEVLLKPFDKVIIIKATAGG